MIDSVDDAIKTLRDQHLPEQERVRAVHYLAEYPSPKTIDVLIEAVKDNDYGVHWAASEALADFGDAPLVPMLEALCRPDVDARLREGFKHAFHISASPRVRALSRPVLDAMHGSAQSISTMEAASELLERLSRSG